MPPGPRKSASSCRAMKPPVARSKTRLRFIFGLKPKSKLSSVRLASRKPASLRRRSSSRSRAARELVGDEAGEEIDGRHRFGLSLMKAGFEHGGHAAEAELAQRSLQFDEVHDWFSWVLSAMRSR